MGKSKEEPREDRLGQIVELLARGYSYRQIADVTHTDLNLVRKVNWEMRSEITRLRESEYSELYSQYHMSRTAKIRLFGEDLEKVEKELQKRSLENLTDDELLEQKQRLIDRLERLYVPLTYDEVDTTTDGILQAYADLYRRVCQGEAVNPKLESQILQGMGKTAVAKEEIQKTKELGQAIDSKR